MPLTLTRSILVVFVPGVVAAAPWFLWLIQHFPNVTDLYHRFPEAVAALVFAATAPSTRRRHYLAVGAAAFLEGWTAFDYVFLVTLAPVVVFFALNIIFW